MSAEVGEIRGRFVVLDGVDGCGKSTQARLLVESLQAAGGDPLHVREPGTTPAGERIRELLLDAPLELVPSVEVLLFAASRRQLLEAVVEPALAQGRDVICERFHSSTFAYQAVAGGLCEEHVLELLQGWAGDPAPDLELILVLDPDEAARRRTCLPDDRIEARGLEFQRVVARGFAIYAERVDRAREVSALGSEQQVSQRILREVQCGD